MKKLLPAALVLALGAIAFFLFRAPSPLQPVIAGGERFDLSIETYGPEPRLKVGRREDILVFAKSVL
jgi:hypothetical protein